MTYVLTGIWNGFRIGWHNNCPLTPAKRNSPSALQQAHVVEQYFSAEITANRVIGPFPVEALQGLQISRMGVIPKGHIPGKWRLITDLSFPPGNSVNDGIDVTWPALKVCAKPVQLLPLEDKGFQPQCQSQCLSM